MIEMMPGSTTEVWKTFKAPRQIISVLEEVF